MSAEASVILPRAIGLSSQRRLARVLLLSEAATLFGIVLFAWFLRMRYLADIPRYTDEVNEVQAAISIAHGTARPLVSGTKHIGALFDYLLAGGILLLGRYPDLPRQLALLVGLLTVPLTYGYARHLGGRVPAAIAAVLLAVSTPHILLSSRVAWSASLTPPLFVAGAWAVEKSVASNRSGPLVLAALLFGMAFQAHPAVAAMLPGIAVFALLRNWRLLLRPRSYLAVPSFALGCFNVLLYNYQSGSGTSGSVEREYPNRVFGPTVYFQQLAAPLDGLIRALGSAFEPLWPPTPMHVFALAVGLICLWSLVYCARHSSSLPLLVTVSALLLLPLANNDFSPLLKARYIMPLVPLVLVATGIALVGVMNTSPFQKDIGGRQLVVFAIVGAFGAGSLFSLTQFESQAIAHDCTNAPQRAFVQELVRDLAPGEWILLDNSVVQPSERMAYLGLLEWSSARVGEVQLRRGGLRKELETRASFVTAVADVSARRLFTDEGYKLLPDDVPPKIIGPSRDISPDSALRNGIGLYRVTSAGARLLAYNPKPGCGDFPSQ